MTTGGEMIQTILAFTCGSIVGCAGMWLVMRLKLDAARATGLLISRWWMAAEDRLDEAHEKHVRAGRTRHVNYRAHVRETAERLRQSLPL